ncbi:MAG: phosphoribosylaminoimidazolesuccinocarboxamide synthase [Acidobacteriota bacterium]
MEEQALIRIELPGVKLYRRGKVRDIFDLGDSLLMVASDRISAFDHVLGSGIPDKGKILTQLSRFWFEFTRHLVPNHLVTTEVEEFPAEVQPYRSLLQKRSMLVKKARLVEIECVVRGYLSGSGWREYQQSGSVCGIKLPAGLTKSAPLPQPIFTPATKATTGHDINLTLDQMADLVGKELTERLQQVSIDLYQEASHYARERGVIIADTKFEFGWWDDSLLLIDELLTPDSSRFWPLDDYQPGSDQPSLDKQFVRDYLESIKWNKEPPVPTLPPDVVENTREKYLEVYRILTGRDDLC